MYYPLLRARQFELIALRELAIIGLRSLNTHDTQSPRRILLSLWTADATEFGIKLVDFGADGAYNGGDDVEHEIIIAHLEKTWTSIIGRNLFSDKLDLNLLITEVGKVKSEV